MKNIFRRMSELQVIVEGDSSEPKKELFKVLDDYLWSGDYTTHREREAFLKIAKRKDDYVARQLGITEPSVRKIRQLYTKDFLKRVDESYLTLLEFGSDKEITRAIRDVKILIGQSPLRDILFPDLIEYVRECTLETNDFEVGDCKYELTLLHWFSKAKIGKLLADIDVSRLEFILRVLEGKAGSSQDRVNIIRVIESDNPLAHAKPEDRKKFTFPPVRPEDEF